VKSVVRIDYYLCIRMVGRELNMGKEMVTQILTSFNTVKVCVEKMVPQDLG